ncbi:zinc finger protein VAR3, chloroplastic-like isoform X2 [Actinidia eriantha]|uniref:zinc finger protein VAR3, chloroplastic-like isoform X2 n=1 Tax=Actinidia eriantha TaxID=165200 RepID=UPI0025831A34|nr:zinc finger protein VAR3, chloroplastic-like isoform X2 [Actinidia eriantha]
MSALRLFSLFGASIFHNRTTLSPSPPIRFNKLFPSITPPLRFRRYASSSAAIDTNSIPCINLETTTSDSGHLWPEWVAFVDRLKAKGYVAAGDSSPAAPVEDEFSVSDKNFYKDMNLLKDASLSFARDRFDIFRLLSKEDIQTVVEIGCPNLFRKAVNSAKRLRSYLQLDEGDVCSSCNLRGSCDRAYVILKESEAAARTVDIVRVLLFYALDPLVIAGGEKPSGRAIVEASARNLLSNLIVLSETPPDPALPKPAPQASHQKKKSLNFVDDKPSTDVEMKRGDWMCPKCNFVNFSRNVRCLKCKSEGPKRVGADDIEMKKGDWNCPRCAFMNFASNRKCLHCQEARPKRQLNPGEWECPSCDFLNYKRNMVCLKCNCERPKEMVTQYEEQMWRRPN